MERSQGFVPRRNTHPGGDDNGRITNNYSNISDNGGILNRLVNVSENGAYPEFMFFFFFKWEYKFSE